MILNFSVKSFVAFFYSSVTDTQIQKKTMHLLNEIEELNPDHT